MGSMQQQQLKKKKKVNFISFIGFHGNMILTLRNYHINDVKCNILRESQANLNKSLMQPAIFSDLLCSDTQAQKQRSARISSDCAIYHGVCDIVVNMY